MRILDLAAAAGLVLVANLVAVQASPTKAQPSGHSQAGQPATPADDVQQCVRRAFQQAGHQFLKRTSTASSVDDLDALSWLTVVGSTAWTQCLSATQCPVQLLSVEPATTELQAFLADDRLMGPELAMQFRAVSGQDQAVDNLCSLVASGLVPLLRLFDTPPPERIQPGIVTRLVQLHDALATHGLSQALLEAVAAMFAGDATAQLPMPVVSSLAELRLFYQLLPEIVYRARPESRAAISDAIAYHYWARQHMPSAAGKAPEQPFLDQVAVWLRNTQPETTIDREYHSHVTTVDGRRQFFTQNPTAPQWWSVVKQASGLAVQTEIADTATWRPLNSFSPLELVAVLATPDEAIRVYDQAYKGSGRVYAIMMLGRAPQSTRPMEHAFEDVFGLPDAPIPDSVQLGKIEMLPVACAYALAEPNWRRFVALFTARLRSGATASIVSGMQQRLQLRIKSFAVSLLEDPARKPEALTPANVTLLRRMVYLSTQLAANTDRSMGGPVLKRA